MADWIEVYFDAEDCPPESVGKIKKGLWKVVSWELDGNNEPIIASARVLKSKCSLEFALDYARKYAKGIRDNKKVFVSQRNHKCKFPLMPVNYELISYDAKR